VLTELAQHLIAGGLLTPEQAGAALGAKESAGGALDTALLEQGAVSELQILRALAEVSGYPPVNLADFVVNRDVAALIPPKIADRFGIVPLSVQGNILHVACCYPAPKRELQEVGFLLNKHLELWVGLEVRIRDWIRSLYGLPISARLASLLASLESGSKSLAAPSDQAPREGMTLEQALTHDLVERLARTIVDEPIVASGRPTAREQGDQKASPEPLGPSLPPSSWEIDDPAPGQANGHLSLAHHSIHPLPSPSKLPGPALGEMPITRYGERDPQAIPEWTLEQARAMLKESAKERAAIIDIALRFARRAFDFAAAFAVLRGTATLWDARGEVVEALQTERVCIPLDASSVFRTVAITRRSYVGPVPADALSSAFLKQLARSPRAIFLFPVEVSSRLVAIFYGDCSKRPLSQRRLADFILFCQDLPAAFQELIVFRRGNANSTPGAPAAGRKETQEWPVESIPSVVWTPEPDPPEQEIGRELITPKLPGRNPVRSDSLRASRSSFATFNPRSGELAGATELSPGSARADSLTTTPVGRKRLPADFGSLLRRLTGPDPEQRSEAMAELSRFPEESANKLALHFPGPSGWSRLPVFDAPEADELGPIPAALSRLGEAGARALAPLLDSRNSDTRYFALLAAGSLPYPDLVDGVLRGLFDLEPDISSAARAAATALRRLPRFEASMRSIRQELAARDPLRRSLAARALGVLHDRESIDGLIGLTSSEDQLCAQAAAEALREITKASFGTNSRQWTSWWAENRERRRTEWLVTALRHRDPDLRLSAIEELAQAFNDNLGYFADGPAAEREAAVKRWEALIREGRSRGLDS